MATAQAWHEAGHRAIGLIALEGMDKSVRAKVDEILKFLPDANTPENSVVPPDPFKELKPGFRLTAQPILTPLPLDVASVWPDWIRRSWLDRPVWHYVNYSINGPGGSSPPVTTGRAVDVIVAMIEVLRDPLTGKSTKAVALAWLAHVLGDLHQPLHAVSYFDTVHPEGDRGGNGYFLKAAGSTVRVPNLHAFWDGVVGSAPEDVPALMTRVKELPAPSAEDVKFETASAKQSVLEWAGESVEIAKTSVYRIGADGSPKLSPDPLAFNPPQSQPDARGIADKRIKLAGLRLRAVLESVFAPPDGSESLVDWLTVRP